MSSHLRCPYLFLLPFYSPGLSLFITSGLVQFWPLSLFLSVPPRPGSDGFKFRNDHTPKPVQGIYGTCSQKTRFTPIFITKTVSRTVLIYTCHTLVTDRVSFTIHVQTIYLCAFTYNSTDTGSKISILVIPFRSNRGWFQRKK